METKFIIEEIEEYEDSESGSEREIEEYFNERLDDVKEDENREESKEEEEIIIGIDLGTTNSIVSVWRNNNLEIIPDSYGNNTIPSVVAFTNKTKYVGRAGKNQTNINPENTYYEVKRLIGRRYDEISVKNDREFLTYEIEPDEDNNIRLKSSLSRRKKAYAPEEISSIILMELKRMAEGYLKQSVNKAVITVPAYFNDSQRQATKDAAKIAGIECERIINEPTAAALAYGLQKITLNKETDINVLVYDNGGGTTDVSLLNISHGMFQVLASTGNTHMGGADFDNRLVSYAKRIFKKKNKIRELTKVSVISLQKLKKACENAKKILSVTWKAVIAVKEFYEGKNLYVTITREEFEKLCRDLFILCLKPVEDVLRSCEMEVDEIDEIILVGGCTRMPRIREDLKLFFKGKEPNTSINPDEVVSAGAALQGYILANKSDPFSENVVLLDIIPLSLGVETIGGVMTVLIPRNSVIPISRKRKFTPDADYETEVNIEIYEGERAMTKDNFKVGEFKLMGLEPAPRGIAQIEITFSVDINGIISVTAEDVDNNKNKSTITITGDKGRLTKEKIDRLIKEAEEMEAKDKIEREKKQLYYEIEELCSNVTINMKNDDFKLKEKDVARISRDIEKVENWLHEMNYMNRRKKEYLHILERIKKKYGTLILKIKKSETSVKGMEGSLNEGGIEATTVYGNDEEEESKYVEIEEDELGMRDMDDEEKKELKRMRGELIELCYMIFDIINAKTLSIEKKHREEMKDYIDDMLLWAHVQEKISMKEYKEKIDEINRECDKIVEKYETVFEQSEIEKQMTSKKGELEQLCYAIKSSILSNIFSNKEMKIKELERMIDATMKWLIECNMNEMTDNKDMNEMYQLKIDEINEACNRVYNSMLNINIMDESIISNDILIISNDILSGDVIKLDKKSESSISGTSIASLRQKKIQQSQIK